MRLVFLIALICSLISCGGDKPKNSFKPERSKPKSEANVKKAATNTETSDIAAKTTAATDESSMTPEQLDKAKAILKSVNEDDVKGVNVKKLFKMHCATCHGFNGAMMINGAKDLTKSKISIEESVAQVYFGKGLMTPYKGVLDDPEIVALCRYIEKDLRK